MAEDENGKKKAATEEERECECCFGDFPLSEMCQCNERHLVCAGCLRLHVQEAVFGENRRDFKCLSLEGCKAEYSAKYVDLAIPDAKVRQRVHQHLYKASVKQANLPDIW